MRPRPVVGEATVPDAVRRLLDKFDYPDRESPAQVIPILPTLAGGGGVPTIMVAASNATEGSKSKADMVCLGTNDHLIIQAAIDLMPFAGGRVFLTEGEFHPDWNEIVLPQRVTLQGVGRNATIVDMNDTNPTTGAGPALAISGGGAFGGIRDLSVWLPSNGLSTQVGIQVGIQIATIEGVMISTSQGKGIDVISTASNVRIQNCFIEECEGPSIYAEDSNRLAILNNHISGGGDWRIWVVAASDSLIALNIISGGSSGAGGIFVNQPDNISIIDNVIKGNSSLKANIRVDNDGAGGKAGPVKISGNLQSFSGSDGMIYIEDIDEFTVTDNQMDDGSGSGVNVTTSINGTIDGNTISTVDEHGVLLTDCDRLTISANHIIEVGQLFDNVYDCVSIAGASDRNLVTTNQLIPSTAANQTRYGVNVGGTGECNMVVGNDLGDPNDYGTDALVDTANNTQLFWPNDATYGDNFTDCGSGS